MEKKIDKNPYYSLGCSHKLGDKCNCECHKLFIPLSQHNEEIERLKTELMKVDVIGIESCERGRIQAEIFQQNKLILLLSKAEQGCHYDNNNGWHTCGTKINMVTDIYLCPSCKAVISVLKELQGREC